MSGNNFQEKTFQIACRDYRSSKNFCNCGGEIAGIVYKRNGQKLCRICWDKIPDKEIGLNKIDAFSEIHDKDLGASYSSLRQKHRLMKQKNITYADDFKASRDIEKEAMFKFGRKGNRKMGAKKWL